ncbi:MAG: hypothetical protein PHT19_17020 [Methylococcus sp.]|nr:hypothetical protein [Methylococcus sp.]
MDESGKNDIDFIETWEHSAKPLESAETPLHLVSLSVHGPCHTPADQFGWIWNGTHRLVTAIQGQLEGFVALVSTVHDEGARFGYQANLQQELGWSLSDTKGAPEIAETGPVRIFVYPAFRSALYAGIRRGEMLVLEWCRVDLGHGLIYLEGLRQNNGKVGSVPLNRKALSA